MQTWWGRYSLQEGEAGQWCVGPMSLWIQRRAHEWRIAYASRNEAFADTCRVEVPCAADALAAAGLHRHSMARTHAELELTPLLADRPIISRPDSSLFLPPGEALTFYIGSPLWLRIGVEKGRTVLQEFPVFRPSDTWYGSMIEGEGLCYATSTLALTELADFPDSPFRAITPLTVRNRGSDRLNIERLNLPVPYLSLYQAEDGRLWTQSVSMERERAHEDMARFSIGKKTPAEAGKCTLVSAARRAAEDNLVIRAFSRLFT